MHEDEVVLGAADLLQHDGWTVLAASANQIARFRFKVDGGRTKSPDLVAWRTPTLLVAEAKVKGSALDRPAADGWSDAQVMAWLASDIDAQKQLAAEATAMLAKLSISPPDVVVVQAALVFATGPPPGVAGGIAVVQVTADGLLCHHD
jgi:hypothetical protein